MRIDPALAAFQRDRAPQQRAQAAMVAACDAWYAGPQAERVLDDLARYGDGAPLLRCPTLVALFTDSESALHFVTELVRAMCTALVCTPLGHPPFRHGFDHGTSTLLLARRKRALLALHAIEPGKRRFESVTLSDGERCEAVLAGAAQAQVVRLQAGSPAIRPRVLRPGVRLALDLADEALQVTDVAYRLVSLCLHRFAAMPGPRREHDLSTGALLRQATGDIRASRQEVMLALLGRMRRAEAAPVMAAIATEPGDPSMRWQALRECLALDPAAGFAALGEVAGVASDPLAGPAGALRAQLREAYPELASLAGVACLA